MGLRHEEQWRFEGDLDVPDPVSAAFVAGRARLTLGDRTYDFTRDKRRDGSTLLSLCERVHPPQATVSYARCWTDECPPLRFDEELDPAVAEEVESAVALGKTRFLFGRVLAARLDES